MDTLKYSLSPISPVLTEEPGQEKTPLIFDRAQLLHPVEIQVLVN